MKTFRVEQKENGNYQILKLCWVWYRWVWKPHGDVYGRLDEATTEYESREVAEREVNTKATGHYEIVD